MRFVACAFKNNDVSIQTLPQNAEYPGIVPYERGRQLFDRDLEQEERSVRGTLVRGLTLTDIGHLDIFEGDVRLPILPSNGDYY